MPFTFLPSLARTLLELPERLRYRQSLMLQGFRPAKGGPALNYHGLITNSTNVAGGKVKLLHLRDRFPEREDFNILYLVSSVMPPFAGELVRWAKRHGAKFVWNQNGVGFPAWAGFRTGEINRPMARLLRQADHVVYQSEFCRTSADRWLGPTHGPSSVLYNPVDTAVFSPAPTPPSLEHWRLLAAGTHYQPYRVLGALETVRVLLDAGHRVLLTVAGAMRWPNADGEVHAAITRLRLAEHVTLRPAFSQEEAVKIYRQAHILLHLKYHDPCPTVAIEALSCGLPVITSDSGGMPELVGKDGGELLGVPISWDEAGYPLPRRIAASVARVMANWPTRSQAARARAEQHFKAGEWVDAHERIFNDLLKSSSK